VTQTKPRVCFRDGKYTVINAQDASSRLRFALFKFCFVKNNRLAAISEKKAQVLALEKLHEKLSSVSLLYPMVLQKLMAASLELMCLQNNIEYIVDKSGNITIVGEIK